MAIIVGILQEGGPEVINVLLSILIGSDQIIQGNDGIQGEHGIQLRISQNGKVRRIAALNGRDGLGGGFGGIAAENRVNDDIGIFLGKFRRQVFDQQRQVAAHANGIVERQLHRFLRKRRRGQSSHGNQQSQAKQQGQKAFHLFSSFDCCLYFSSWGLMAFQASIP